MQKHIKEVFTDYQLNNNLKEALIENINLFLDKKGEWVTSRSLYNTLKELEADKCEILYIHSSLSFGTPNPQLKKSQLLGSILDVIKALGVKTICMPTFTFSFCNGKDYDPAKSASKMGALNEYFRKQVGVLRSVDPQMSTALLGEDKDLVLNIGHSSCGANSTFDKLRHRNGVKFLFIGPKIGDCMTYMHYLEWLYGVDYRYERVFRGNISINGVTSVVEYDLFCRYEGVTPNNGSYIYEQKMYDNGIAQITYLGDGHISIVEEKAASEAYKQILLENPSFFVDYADNYIKNKTYRPIGEVVAM